MKTYQADFSWQDAECNCGTCRVTGGPHVRSSAVCITCEDESELNRLAEDAVRRSLPSGVSFEILSISFDAEGEFSRIERSLTAEEEVLGLDATDEAPKDWLSQLAAAGLRSDLDGVLAELVHDDGKERLLVCIDEYGLEGHRVMEAVAALVLGGKATDGNRLYRQLKNLAIRLQE